MASLFAPHEFLCEPATGIARREQAAALGMSAHAPQHGDVIILRTPAVEIMFLSGVPAAYLDKRLRKLFVVAELKGSPFDWHREQIERYWRRRDWHWTEHEKIFAALTCRREHNPQCTREHNGKCRRVHFERCTRPHLRRPPKQSITGTKVT